MNDYVRNKRLMKAEDYISNMISTIMTVSAVLSTISVGVLAIVSGMNAGFAKFSITGLILISVFFFILAFSQGRKSYGKLIWALGQDSVIGYDHARITLQKCLKSLKYGLICLGFSCFVFYLDMAIPFIKKIQTLRIITMIDFNLIFGALGYLFIIIGAIGMISFAKKFPLSTRIKDLESKPDRLLHYLNGYQVWLFSWLLILAGSLIQLIMICVT